MVFIALACGQQLDHSTIATFVSSMKDGILPPFRDVLLVCQEIDLLGGTFFALDGLKLPSNASKEWSGTRSELQRKKERFEGDLWFGVAYCSISAIRKWDGEALILA